MNMNVMREYLVSDTTVNTLVGENIFLFEKPDQIKADNYIIYNFKEINGGQSIRDYQLDFRIVSKDKLKLFPIKDQLIQILDNFNKPTKIKDSNTVIRHTRLINGGGIIKNEESREYNLLVYFLVKI